MKGLTLVEYETYQFIIDYHNEKGCDPSFREICKHFKICLSTCWQRINNLEKKSYIYRNKNSRRKLIIN